ncbi:nitroreductase family protein [Dethiobacter alkaliphilus]|uniref:Nitroreductase n=1 Tax=Dethiobacter alkaliphilus AHT 1 TaxID=555088 RepID=C0GCF3_DETAL|nr:nitroreductase family protein [Dethiobacter alkaliphilus]EEG78888.1 nitroreductase [Dethiobacter alkaliphilus AHT 1]
MELLELAQKRYSVRKFDSKPVEKEKVKSILEFGRLAPTAKNLQPHKLLVLQEKDSLAKLDKSAKVYGAPLAIVTCADLQQSWKRPFDNMDSADIDVSIVTTYMMLEATRLDLGTLWVCYFNPEVLRNEFNLPEHIVPVNVLGIGYAASDAPPSPGQGKRKPLEETVSFETHNWM